MSEEKVEKSEESGTENKEEDKKEDKSRVSKFHAGEILIKEGDEGRSLFILRTGSVKVFKTYLGRKLMLGILGPGEVFGELSFFDGHDRVASVQAIENGEAIEVDANKVQADLDSLPPWMKGVLKTVIGRLRETDSMLALLQNKYDLSKGSSKADSVGQEIYLELKRINKVFELYFGESNKVEDSGENFDKAVAELNVMLTGVFLQIEKIFEIYENNGFISRTKSEDKSYLSLNKEEIEAFSEYLESQIKNDSTFIFTRETLGALRSIISFVPGSVGESDGECSVLEVVDPAKIKSLPIYTEFLKEMKDYGFTSGNPSKLDLTLNLLQTHFKYQSILTLFNLKMV